MKFLLLAVVLAIWLAEIGLAVYRNQHVTVRTSKYDKSPIPSFISLPTFVDDHGIEEYEEVRLERGFRFPLRLFCLRGDPSLCLFFDRDGHLAGFQISYPIKRWRMNRRIYNMSNNNFIETNFFNIPAKSVRIYIINPEEGRCKTSSELVEGLWTEYGGVLVKYDFKCQLNSPVMGDFKLLGCSPLVGQVYAKDLSDREDCGDGAFHNMLYENRKMIGLCHTIPGIVAPGPNVNIYNYPNGTGAQELVPYSTPCLDIFKPYGFTIVTIWFIKDPWYIRCPKCHCD